MPDWLNRVRGLPSSRGAPEEFGAILLEATQQAEDLLNLEDEGWIQLGTTTDASTISDSARRTAIERARTYAAKDPLAVQAVRLWTSYTFGTGMTWAADDADTDAKLRRYWDAPENSRLLSSSGQRRSSDMLVINGEVFFALFLQANGKAIIRRIDPLEIRAFVTDPDDAENVRFYKRQWTDTAGQTRTAYYRSAANIKNEGVNDSDGNLVQSSEDAIVFHLPINSIGQRGTSMLYPALDWIYMYRSFLASRYAIMKALSVFAWKGKVKGGAAAIARMKAKLDAQTPEAGAVEYENEGFELTPMNANSQARNAMDDARLLKYQICAAVGWPEPYFGDISTGNWATAKVVELPVLKQCQILQDAWRDFYAEIDEVVMEHMGIGADKRAVTRDFPDISPEDTGELAKSIQAMVTAFPDMAGLKSVLQRGLLAIGIDDPTPALDELFPDDGSQESADVRAVARATHLLHGLKEILSDHDNGRDRGVPAVRGSDV